MTTITVPHNWQPELLDALDLSCVGEFYGKLESDPIGGGRASNISVPVDRKMLAGEVRRIHARGKRFNYLLNSICLDNKELTRRMQDDLARLVDWLVQIGIDGVTVTLPYLLEYVRRRAPKLYVTVSTMSHVDTSEKARFWEELGADRITLDEVIVNRDFFRLAAIRRAVRCKLQLIVNNGCLRDCPFTTVHAAASSHGSQCHHATKGFFLDFYWLYCRLIRLRDITQFVRGDWIRPEDLAVYEQIGIDSFKLVNRGMATQWLARIVRAYTDRRYDGNLLDLLPSPGKSLVFSGPQSFFRALRYFGRPGSVNLFRMLRSRQVISELEGLVRIDNRSLDGFLEALRQNDCRADSCRECRICVQFADTAVRVDPERFNRVTRDMETLMDSFISGEIFRYR